MALNKLLAATVTYPDLTGPGKPIAASAGVSALENIVGQVIGVMSIIAVLYFTFQIIIAGYSFIAASGDQKAIETARHAMTNSVLGLTIVIVAVGLGALIATLLGIPSVLDLENMFNLMGL